MEVGMMIENEVVEIDNDVQDPHPRCPGCNEPIRFAAEYPYCACGCLLFWPTPERI